MTITLKFAEKELKCSLGLMFLGNLIDELDMGIEEIGEKMQKNPFRLMPKMIHLSAETEADLDGRDFDLTLRDVVEMMEADGGLSSPAAAEFMKQWVISMTGGVPETESAEEGDEEPKQ